MKRSIACLAALAIGGGCATSRTAPEPEHRDMRPRPSEIPSNEKPSSGAPDIEAMLSQHPGLRPFVERAEDFKLQVVLGTVEEPSAGHGTGSPRLVQTGFRRDAEYFYPASTVKLFAAVAALEHLARIRDEAGLPVDVDTPLIYHPLFDDESLESADESNLDGGTITVRHEIRKLFLVSDNRAFNRLYELVGQDGLARSLSQAGIRDARIVHRLSEWRSVEDNRRFPRIDFRGPGFDHTLPERRSPPLSTVPGIDGLRVGRAHLAGGERLEKPFDFSTKNRIRLADLQRGLCMVVRPDIDCGGNGFSLAEEDRRLLLDAMAALPRESKNPRYEPEDYPDDYVKFLLPGLARVVPRDRLRIVNKIGQAYGFTTENAYIEDTATGRSFFIAATLYTNEDGVLNDDRYEYEDVALPFMADLGEALARHLLKQSDRRGRQPKKR